MAHFVDYDNAEDLMTAISNKIKIGLKWVPVYADTDTAVGTFLTSNNVLTDDKIKAVYIPRITKYLTGNGMGFCWPSYSGTGPWKLVSKTGSGTYHNKTIGFRFKAASGGTAPSIPAITLVDSMLIKGAITGSSKITHLTFDGKPRAYAIPYMSNTLEARVVAEDDYGSDPTDTITISESELGGKSFDISDFLINYGYNQSASPGQVSTIYDFCYKNENNDNIYYTLQYGTSGNSIPIIAEKIMRELFHFWERQHIMYDEDINVGQYDLVFTGAGATSDYGNQVGGFSGNDLLTMYLYGGSGTRGQRPIAFLLKEL